MEENITRVINENADKLEIGTPAKGGSMRISGDFSKPEEFKKKVDYAIEVRNYANAKIEIKFPDKPVNT